MKSVQFIVLIASAVSCLSALAGPNDSGGGKGVVCRNKDGSIKSVELLDLWEARELYDRKIVYSNASVDQQTGEGIDRLKNVTNYPYGGADALAGMMIGTAITINKPSWVHVKRLRGVRLTLTADSFEDATPEACSVEQLIQYKDVGPEGVSAQVLINQDLVDRMDATNKAALALHEALYAEMRKFGEKTSIRVRRAVGYVMSGQSFKPLDSFLTGKHITCESKNKPDDFRDGAQTLIHFIREPHGFVSVLPEKVGGVLMMGFEYINSGTPTPIEEVIERLQRGVTYDEGSLPYSPVDFDLNYSLVGHGKSDGLTIKLIRTASGVQTPVTDRLRCFLVNE